MLFTPKYTVSYHGMFHRAGTSFEIDPGDADEMSQHGTVEAPVEPDPGNVQELPGEAPPARKPGRPKKTN